MTLSTLFSKVSLQFRTEFELVAAEIRHRGLAGEARETALRHLLASYLPRRAGVGTGVVIDAAGHESRQADVVVFDRAASAVWTVGGVDFFPCEGVIAVGEVKTQIDSVSDLETALTNIASVKGLDRSAGGTNELVTGPGVSIPIRPRFDPAANHRDQIFGFLFTGGSLAEANLLERLVGWNRTHPKTVWPNLYCDYERFLISYEDAAHLNPSPMDARKMYCTDPSETPNLLLLFVCILADFVNQAHVARANYFEYGGIGATRHRDYEL